MNKEKGVTVYVYAEYCPGDFFWGWWLYVAPVANGKADRGKQVHGHWWIHWDWLLDNLMRALGLPELLDYRGSAHTEYTEAFLRAYPQGAIMEFDGREFERAPQDTETVLLWRCFKGVREDQLLDWKKSDTSYLGKQEAEMAAAENPKE